MLQKIKKAFIEKFNKVPILYRSPGRINLIGEHTDYNDGFVLPASVDKAIYFAVASNNDNVFRFYSYDFQDYYETNIKDINKSSKHWANYLLGVIAQFYKDGKQIQGFDCVFGGDIPVGAGMSSSAALECGLAYAVNDIHNWGYSVLQMVKMAQKAEHEYAGVMCGIMDQFAVMHGKKNKAILLDTRSLDYKYIPVDIPGYKFILVNTGVKHSLAASEYNKRRNECQTGVKILQKYNPDIKSLRDTDKEFIRRYEKEMNPIIYKRCTYVIEENMRVEKAVEALTNNDFMRFGELMFFSHEGLKEKYEVSCTELDMLVDLAKNTKGVAGARMMGGGFGGCTLNLVEESSIPDFINTVLQNYKTPDGKAPDIIKVAIEDGTGVIKE